MCLSRRCPKCRGDLYFETNPDKAWTCIQCGYSRPATEGIPGIDKQPAEKGGMQRHQPVKCQKCGRKYIGWALKDPKHQTCDCSSEITVKEVQNERHEA